MWSVNNKTMGLYYISKAVQLRHKSNKSRLLHIVWHGYSSVVSAGWFPPWSKWVTSNFSSSWFQVPPFSSRFTETKVCLISRGWSLMFRWICCRWHCTRSVSYTASCFFFLLAMKNKTKIACVGEGHCRLAWRRHGDWEGDSSAGPGAGGTQKNCKWNSALQSRCLVSEDAILLRPLVTFHRNHGNGTRVYSVQTFCRDQMLTVIEWNICENLPVLVQAV